MPVGVPIWQFSAMFNKITQALGRVSYYVAALPSAPWELHAITLWPRSRVRKSEVVSIRRLAAADEAGVG
jgi:hypothetical protein